MKFRFLVGVVLLLVCAGCSSDGGSLPAPPGEIVSEKIGFTEAAEQDTSSGVTCDIMWSMQLPTGGAGTHPALGQGGGVHVTGSGKLYTLRADKTGIFDWVWPDDDTQGAVDPIDAQLYTPVVGSSGTIYMGTGDERLLAVNKGGEGRWVFELDGQFSGAPTVYKGADNKQKVFVVTDVGSLYCIKDLGQKNPHPIWKKEGEQGIANPKPGEQPIIGPKIGGGNEKETIWVVSLSGMQCFAADGFPMWTYESPEGYTTTSNAVMDGDGNALFVAGKDPNGDYFHEHYLMKVDEDGEDAEGSNVLIDLPGIVTEIVSLSIGNNDRLLMGTSNAGLIIFNLKSGTVYKHMVADEENFLEVAQPVQAKNGFIYMGVFPTWLYVLGMDGEVLCRVDLDEFDPSIKAQLQPSSPLILSDGMAIFHSGQWVTAIKASDSGPSESPWPRFGGNDRNSGNIHDSVEL